MDRYLLDTGNAGDVIFRRVSLPRGSARPFDAGVG